MKSFIKNCLGVIAVAALVFVTALFISKHAEPVLASVPQGSDYQGTTTTQATYAAIASLKTGVGALGRITITGSSTGIVNFYDATTTNIALRAASKSTSSILLASLPGSLSPNDYEFDRAFYNGLITEIIGTTPTSTITYR